ncbi:pregnancy zone protein-like isoform X2 [Hemicordylus capensis]|uniref:pregnancy zone protein-like isoform X2 n=1 Tax=Hemicordylus capensis TaxID=884348 RepID=UPI0023045206|nr:pregnancy zone protein-like isoform X2 [Hemicordylus capensis]
MNMADGQGCFSQVVQTKVFQLMSLGYKRNIDVEGQIKEEGTGVKLTSTGSTEITGILSKITFEKRDTYFKPGIPFFGQVKLVDGAEVPLANKTIQITAFQTIPVPRFEYKANYTTDAKGIVQFSIDTSNFTEHWKWTFFLVQADFTFQGSRYGAGGITLHHQRGFPLISNFYSPSRSYLYIEPVPGTLSCGQTQPVRVHHVLNSDVLEEEKVTFNYLVMAKGRIVKTGTHPLLLEHKKDKGTFLLDLSVDIHMAPLACLLLYTILPNGELVAHSADCTVEKCFANKVVHLKKWTQLAYQQKLRESISGPGLNLRH